MESDSRDRTPPATPTEQLDALAADRERLATRLAPPAWLAPATAAIAAALVASPAITDDGARSIVVGVLAGAFLAVGLSLPRLSGIRPARRAGVRPLFLLGRLLVVTLFLLSAAFGLAASLAPAWALAPAVVCGLVVLVGVRGYHRVSQERVRRGD